MQKILGYMRKAIQEFDLIQDGDRIAVGVSGGKDSLVLLQGLAMLRRFIGIDYELVAITLDPQFGEEPGDFSEIAAMCKDLGVPYVVLPTDIGKIVFEIRQEASPCSLCARMRRGALHDAAVANGCNKIALGHHFNDAVETFVMNLFIDPPPGICPGAGGAPGGGQDPSGGAEIQVPGGRLHHAAEDKGISCADGA